MAVLWYRTAALKEEMTLSAVFRKIGLLFALAISGVFVPFECFAALTCKEIVDTFPADEFSRARYIRSLSKVDPFSPSEARDAVKRLQVLALNPDLPLALRAKALDALVPFSRGPKYGKSVIRFLLLGFAKSDRAPETLVQRAREHAVRSIAEGSAPLRWASPLILNRDIPARYREQMTEGLVPSADLEWRFLAQYRREPRKDELALLDWILSSFQLDTAQELLDAHAVVDMALQAIDRDMVSSDEEAAALHRIAEFLSLFRHTIFERLGVALQKGSVLAAETLVNLGAHSDSSIALDTQSNWFSFFDEVQDLHLSPIREKLEEGLPKILTHAQTAEVLHWLGDNAKTFSPAIVELAILKLVPLAHTLVARFEADLRAARQLIEVQGSNGYDVSEVSKSPFLDFDREIGFFYFAVDRLEYLAKSDQQKTYVKEASDRAVELTGLLEKRWQEWFPNQDIDSVLTPIR